MLVLSRTTETRSCVGPTPNVAVCAPAYPLGTYGDKAKPPVESPDGFAAKSANDWPLPAAVVDHSPSTRSSHISSAMLVRQTHELGEGRVRPARPTGQRRNEAFSIVDV